MDKDEQQMSELIKPIRDDLLSGAAEIALRAITIFQTVMNEDLQPAALKQKLIQTARALINSQPAMAPVFHLSNTVLLAIEKSKTAADIRKDCQNALDHFEKTLCDSAAAIAETVFELIPPGELIFAYSFSSTVVSALLNARSRGRYFRVACTEARPSLEGRKLAARLASGGIEVIHTFDNAMSLVLPNCSTAFMGCDCVAGRASSIRLAHGCWQSVVESSESLYMRFPALKNLSMTIVFSNLRSTSDRAKKFGTQCPRAFASSTINSILSPLIF